MFLKLLTIIFALCGGVKAPPPLHKQRQPNTIKETYVEKGWELYNIFDANTDIYQNWNLEYNVLKPSVINIININNNTEQSPFLTLHINYEVDHKYFINWNFVSNNENTSLHSPSLIKSGTSIKNYIPFVTSFNVGDDPYVVLVFDDYNNFLPTDNFTFTINVIDLTTNPIPTFDGSNIELWTEQGVNEEVNTAIANTKKSFYPLYNAHFDYILSPGDSISRIPLPFRNGDFTRVYKSDLYNTINSIVGNVSNNFTIQIDLPMKNTRDINIFAKGNNLELKKFGIISYSYTQGNNIFSINLPNDNREFNSIFLSFYDFNSISSNDVVLSVSNRFEEVSYQEGYDKGFEVGNKDGYDKGLTDGHNEGYEQGHGEGFQLGYDTGNQDGYDTGYNKGYNDGLSKEDINPFKLVSTAFESVGKILSVNVFGGITIATLIAIPFMFLVVLFILKLMKG